MCLLDATRMLSTKHLYLAGMGSLLNDSNSLALWMSTGQVGLVVGSWPSNRATEGSNPK